MPITGRRSSGRSNRSDGEQPEGQAERPLTRQPQKGWSLEISVGITRKGKNPIFRSSSYNVSSYQGLKNPSFLNLHKANTRRAKGGDTWSLHENHNSGGHHMWLLPLARPCIHYCQTPWDTKGANDWESFSSPTMISIQVVQKNPSQLVTSPNPLEALGTRILPGESLFPTGEKETSSAEVKQKFTLSSSSLLLVLFAFFLFPMPFSERSLAWRWERKVWGCQIVSNHFFPSIQNLPSIWLI